MQNFAEIMLRLDKGFKENSNFRSELEKLLSIQSLVTNPFESSGSDGLILTIIMQLANFS